MKQKKIQLNLKHKVDARSQLGHWARGLRALVHGLRQVSEETEMKCLKCSKGYLYIFGHT